MGGMRMMIAMAVPTTCEGPSQGRAGGGGEEMEGSGLADLFGGGHPGALHPRLCNRPGTARCRTPGEGHTTPGLGLPGT
jgi:hypothetical protein